jgi:endoglucanase
MIALASLGLALAGGLAAASAPALAAPPPSREVAIASRAGAAQKAASGPRAAAMLAMAWPGYRKAFIQPEGRVVDRGNQGISHSEGQGYAMVLAVAAQDRETFARLWEWTSRELYIRPDGLAAWRWEPGQSPHVTDRNNASDGDLLIAWALGEAGLRWDAPEYTQAMRKITAALFSHAVIDSRVGPVLLPGVEGFDAKSQPDGPVVNLSYWIFPAIDRLEVLSPEQDWAGLRRSGLSLLRTSRFGPLRIPPEWLSIGAKQSKPAAKFERSFSYNAVRIPLYLAWSSRVPADQLRPFLTMWNAAQDVGPFIIDIDDGKANGVFDAPGYRMIFALTQCIAAAKPVPYTLATGKNDLYYPATLSLLSILAISERRPQCL